MKWNKKLVSIISSIFITGSGVAVGVGFWHIRSNKTNKKSLDKLITITNLETIDNNKRENLIELIRQKNPNVNLDFDKLDLDIQTDKVIVKPKVGDKTYKGEVELSFKLSVELSSLITETNLGIIDESENTDQILLQLVKEKNPNLDINKVDIVRQENKVFIKAKSKDKTYKGIVEVFFALSIDLSNLIKDKNLGTIEKLQLTEEKIIELIRQKNPSVEIDFSKLHLVINEQEGKVTIKPKTGDKTYKRQVNLKFDLFTENDTKIIQQIKSIWNTEFKNRFRANRDNVLGRDKAHRFFFERLVKHKLSIKDIKFIGSTINDSNKIIFKFIYKNYTNIELDGGTINTKPLTEYHQYKGNEVTKIGYYISNIGFTIGQFKPTTNKVPSQLPDIINDLSNAFSGNKNKEIKGLENWDTSNVINMFGTFAFTDHFNQDISTREVMGGAYKYVAWNVSNVLNMRAMFRSAQEFNQNISNWDTSKVIDMREMFSVAWDFNQDISRWNVDKVVFYDDFNEFGQLKPEFLPEKFRK
ncbi:BspA family leucine-rich repeat surface protein [Mycoplasma yeatsii]|uniref:BspA family leucine-rich repeat surface protein n=1 Tax=Mycoplasma yeatsii TaxID=51365 RepID=UPI0005B23BB7|nr:BspA family leucine-rich repeat surface protein [Mycoplasma yeatsii]AJM71652.1 PARCEL domain-containing protein [Mycoplasma yeatsii GM274B]